MSSSRSRSRLVLAVLLVGCGSSESRSVPLGGDVCARIDDRVAISSELVRRAAVEGRVTKDEALERLVSDAIGAEEALAAKVDERPETRARIRAALARSVVERAQAEAKALGPPTDDEVKGLSFVLWYDVDRPVMRASVHAVVMRPKSDAEIARAREMAATIRTAVLPASTAEAMMALAKATVPGPGLEVKVEALPPVASDGYLRDNSTFDKDYVKALFAIPAVGGTSGVVESAFGFHVIRLVDIQPEHRIPFEERRRMFTAEAQARRAKASIERIVTELRGSRKVEISPAAFTILDGVEWSRP